MGLHTGADPGSGIGNTSKPTTPSVSGVSAAHMDIYNYNEITVHYSLGDAGALNLVSTLRLDQSGCTHNGQPMWIHHDGFYDGDFDVPYISHTGHHHERHVDGRFGSAMCEGASHKLRYGGGTGEQGKWEFVTHGHITSWTTANTLNFFQIQGSGDTTGNASSVAANNVAGAAGRWINATGTTDNYPYGRFRLKNTTSDVGGLTGITTNGVIE